MATKTPRPEDFNLDELLEDIENPTTESSGGLKKWYRYLLILVVLLLLLGGGIWYLNSSTDQATQSTTELLGPIDTVESFGWEELDSVCLNNRIIGAAPLKGICGPSWEKIFTQITEFIQGPTEVVTVTETQTVFRPGNRVYLAQRDPRAQEGIAGDVFINRSTGNLYRKIENAWNLSANLSVERIITEVETVTVTNTVFVPGGAGEGSASLGACDDNVNVTARPGYKALVGWYISEVTFSDVNAACSGQNLMIELLDGSEDTLAEGEKTISGTSITFTCNPDSNGLCGAGGDLTTPLGVTALSGTAEKIIFAIYD
jgi:hypothetical protein